MQLAMLSTPFDAWGILEIFGHTRIAGRITCQDVGGCFFIRVDVPDVPGQPAFTRLYGARAVFAITPLSEGEARELARVLKAATVEPPLLRPELPEGYLEGELTDG